MAPTVARGPRFHALNIRPAAASVIAAATEVWFENPAVGQRSRLVVAPGETGGRQFVLDYINQPFAGQRAVPAHIHTTYVETFEILKGRARYRLGAETKTAAAGERIVMPPMVPHVHPWSDSAEELTSAM